MAEYTPIVLINFLRKTLPPGDTIPAEAVTNLVENLAAKAPAEHSHTKEEIEAVLVGQITSHTHPGGGSLPDIVLSKNAPSASQIIPAGYSGYIPGGYEIVAGAELEIASGACFEIA